MILMMLKLKDNDDEDKWISRCWCRMMNDERRIKVTEEERRLKNIRRYAEDEDY